MNKLLHGVVEFARQHSPYYRELYSNQPKSGWQFIDLPLTDQASYWQYNTIKDNRVLTGTHTDGMMFKSGGTTGNPKFSFFSRQEWSLTTDALARGLMKNGLTAGDRVANLFYAGELYSSFIVVNDSLAKVPGTVHYPLAGNAPLKDILRTVHDFSINVLFGTPTTILRFVDYIFQQQVRDLCIDKIFFAGETMYEDQRRQVQELWPEVVFRSSTYATVDAGMIAYADTECGFNEHRQFDGYCFLEILDDEGHPVIEPGVEGKIYVTSLIRRLMPLIRYPSGDKGIWLEPLETPGRKFRLLGRSDEGARIGPMTVYVQDIVTVLNSLEGLKWNNFQLIIKHQDKLDKLIIRIQADYNREQATSLSQVLSDKVYAIRPMFADLLAKQLVHPLEIEWITPEQLIINQRTGKITKIVDQRFQV